MWKILSTIMLAKSLRGGPANGVRHLLGLGTRVSKGRAMAVFGMLSVAKYWLDRRKRNSHPAKVS